MEVSVDDMLVKFRMAKDLVEHLADVRYLKGVPDEAQPLEVCFWGQVRQVLGLHGQTLKI